MDNALSLSSILQGLHTSFVGRHILSYATVTSTMDIAKRAANEGASEGTIVIAEEQTAGRGRLGRSWLSPRGGLALSIILRPELRYLPKLIMLSSLAASHSIEQSTGIKPAIKWPNDVLIKGKKVCGILIENSIRRETVDWAIIGIGINVNLDPADFPEISTIATSLSAELGRKVERLDILCKLLDEIELLYLALRRGEPIHQEWKGRLETLGKMVRISSGSVLESGFAESVDADGSLLLRHADGSLAIITVGDVTLLR